MHTYSSFEERQKERCAFKDTLHSKLALDFLAGLKYIFLENFYNKKNDLDWCRRYLDILGRKVLKDADV